MLARLHQAPRSVTSIVGVLTVVVLVSLVGGLVAAVAGGSLSDLGDGYGGLYGLPSSTTTLVALAAIPVSVVAARRAAPDDHRLRAAIVVAGGAWVIAVGYAVVAHIVDPCVNGWWDARSRIGAQPLCERFGTELNWHTRFHLLAHAAPAALMLAGYVTAVRRWGGLRPAREGSRAARAGV